MKNTIRFVSALFIILSLNNFLFAKTQDSYSWTGEVSKTEDIELPLSHPDQGVYIDDFKRRVTDDIRKEAKKMYQEQEQKKAEEEKANEISKIEDIVLPIHKFIYIPKNIDSNEYYIEEISYSSYYYYNNYNYSNYDNLSIGSFYVFYDDLARKISDDLIVEANKIFNKQMKKKKLDDWKKTDFSCFWGDFIDVITVIIIIMVIIFGIAATIKWIKNNI